MAKLLLFDLDMKARVVIYIFIFLLVMLVLCAQGNVNKVFASSELTPMYRLYNTKNGAYLYVRGDADKNHVMSTWPEFEFTDGVPAFYASLSEQLYQTPIYRLYNTKNGMYLYTRGEADRNHVMSTWPEFEFTDGVPAFYASLIDNGEGAIPIYRLYNTTNGAYLYTRGETDRAHVTNTWPEFEYTDGVPAFYALTDVYIEPLTVDIGTQTWMKHNLNVGLIIKTNQDMSNNGTIEKWCYGNVPNNCNVYGGLYQWDEMMQYSITPGAQGICPIGFHLPTDTEWKTLERSLGMSTGDVNLTGWRGTTQGTLLKADVYGTFGAFLGGWGLTLFGDNLGFSDIDVEGNYWSSSAYDINNSWTRMVSSTETRVFRYYGLKTNAYSVRCIKD